MWKTIRDFFANEHIQIALATGSSIIILSLFFKRYLEVPVPKLESALPGFVFVAFEVIQAKRKKAGNSPPRTWPWILVMYAVVAVIMARHLWLAAG